MICGRKGQESSGNKYMIKSGEKTGFEKITHLKIGFH